MILTTTCPLRISLVGGSTDHPDFLSKFGTGKVISFPSNLKTYVTIQKDILGINSLEKKFILNYSKREEVDTIDEIQNELVKNCFSILNVPQINLFLTSDVFSSGSGLASSSSYLMALIKSIYSMRDLPITESNICKLALEIERKFNPLVGQQDFYGSLGGFKKITFFKDSNPEIKYLDTEIFDEMDMYLVYTGVVRSSTDVLKTIDIDSCHRLLDDVNDLEFAIERGDINLFNQIIKRTWINKKKTSLEICSNQKLTELDRKLFDDKDISSHKLLGAGNGGFFLIFTKKNIYKKLQSKYGIINKINISDVGIKTFKM